MIKKILTRISLGLIFIIFFVTLVYLFIKNTNNKLTFENNLKCAQYIEKENKEIERIQNLPVNKDKAVVTAPKIFFSQKLNTCISAFSINNMYQEFDSYYINNLLNNDTIFSEGGSRNQIYTEDISWAEFAKQQYYSKLKEIGDEVDL